MKRITNFTIVFFLLNLFCVRFSFASQSSDDAYYNEFTVCSDSTVIVEEMSLYCDSPGSYYYGSNKYRNSASCQAGDKAKLQIHFQITYDLTNDPYLTLNVQGYGTIEGVTVVSRDSFCDSVSALNGVSCPEAGYYLLRKQFYWGSQSDSYEYSFVPKIIVGIASLENSNGYDLGGANTKNCNSGNYFKSWTSGVRRSAANTFSTFMITFGILCGTILSIALFTWCVMQQTKPKKEEIIVDEDVDETEYYKIAALVGTDKGLV